LGPPITFDEGVLEGRPFNADENMPESRFALAGVDIVRLQERRFDAPPVIALVGLGAVLLIGMIGYQNSDFFGE
jgi:hypothetical protein